MTERVTQSDDGVVYDLDADCTVDDLQIDGRYHATVDGVVEYGVFVELADEVSGLVHESELDGTDHEVGDDTVVRLLEVRENGDLAFATAEAGDRATERVLHEPTITAVSDLESGGDVTVEGEVVQIKQTSGPTVVRVRDETGIVACAAFEEAGVRAYPELRLDEAVRVSGVVGDHDGGRQIEVESVTALPDDAASAVRDRVAGAVETLAAPAEVDPLVEWPAFEPIREDLREVARLLRRTVLEGRPIRIRHHADGDGMCAALPVQLALERFVREVNADDGAVRHLLKRLPSKAPFYEMEDVTRDLNFALEGRSRHGQKLPFLLMLDNGSTEEDVPAYRNLAHYDVPIAVVDHHHPDPDAVGPLLDAHVNPYLHGEDYRITTGMMCVELARMVDPGVTDELGHVSAVAGLSDRSDADAMTDYLSLAAETGYDRDDLENVSEALDYAAHWLRYSEGHPLVTDVLNVDCDDRARHDELVEFLATRSERDVARQIEAVGPHVEHERLASGAHLYLVDVDEHAHRFTYPAPGKTTGALHDRRVEEHGEPVVTVGYGPDFAVLRSDGVRLDIPRMVEELVEELPEAGISGGGHLVVGSIKFVPGRREATLDRLAEKMGAAAIDEDLGAAAGD